MRRSLYAAVISVALLAACSNSDLLAPVPAASKVASSVLLDFNTDQPVRISEFHYDNAGDTDFNEWFEISAPGGTSRDSGVRVMPCAQRTREHECPRRP